MNESIWKRNKPCALAMQQLGPCLEVYWWQQATEMLARARAVYPDSHELHDLLTQQRDGYEQAIVDMSSIGTN